MDSGHHVDHRQTKAWLSEIDLGDRKGLRKLGLCFSIPLENALPPAKNLDRRHRWSNHEEDRQNRNHKANQNQTLKTILSPRLQKTTKNQKVGINPARITIELTELFPNKIPNITTNLKTRLKRGF